MPRRGLGWGRPVVIDSSRAQIQRAGLSMALSVWQCLKADLYSALFVGLVSFQAAANNTLPFATRLRCDSDEALHLGAYCPGADTGFIHFDRKGIRANHRGPGLCRRAAKSKCGLALEVEP